MIKVTLFKENGSVVRVRACGHSGLAESGSDVLCAAVSTLVQTAYLAMVDMVGKTDFVRDEDSATFEFCVPDTDKNRREAEIIIRAMYVGLRDLSSGYPQNLILEES